MNAKLQLRKDGFSACWTMLPVALALAASGNARGQIPNFPPETARAPDGGLELELRTKDQALLDQTSPRDRSMWEATLTPDAVTLDENGGELSRAEMLNGLADRPPSISIRTEMTSYRVRRWGNMATVIHTDAETESFHGQIIHSIFLTTETWILTPSGWQVALIHVFAAPKDPPSVPLSAHELAQYKGRYQASSDLFYDINLVNATLVGAREGKPEVRLLTELRDVFFVKGQPRSRKIFQRDASGHITGFVDRREGRDIAWRRIGTASRSSSVTKNTHAT